MTDVQPDFTGLFALFINCTLKRSPEVSHTQGLIDISTHIMGKARSRSPGSARSRLRHRHLAVRGAWPDDRGGGRDHQGTARA